MSEQIPKRTRARRRVRQNEGAVVKAITKKSGGAVTDSVDNVERFVGEDVNDPAYVTVGGKLTRNLGNYESVQITVSVTLPCEPTEQAVRAIRAKASSLVEEFVDLELKSIEENV